MADSTIQGLESATSLNKDDVIPFSQKQNEADGYVTQKMTLQQLEEAILSDIYPSIKSWIGSDLSLGELAYKNKISDGDINPESHLTLTAVINGWGDLALKNESHLSLGGLAHLNKDDLGLKKLAKQDVIDLDCAQDVRGKLPLEWLNAVVGSLMSTDYEDLKLSALAHQDMVNLSQYGVPGGVYGRLDFKQAIKNFEPYQLSVAKSSQQLSDIGGINVGYDDRNAGNPTHSRYRNYAVDIDSNGQAYVHVPWQNDNTTSSYAFTDGVNGFVVRDQDGNAKTVAVLPSIPKNITGQGAAKHLAVFDSTQTLSSGPQLGIKTNTYLRENGTFGEVPVATSSSAGLMSATDKKKLDSLSSDLPDPAAISQHSTTQVIYEEGDLYTGSQNSWTEYVWTSPGECLITVSIFMSINAASTCGNKTRRTVQYCPMGSAHYAIVLQSGLANETRSITLKCKAGDKVKINGSCSSSHATHYCIAGTYLA